MIDADRLPMVTRFYPQEALAAVMPNRATGTRKAVQP
jgi:hypothetical protein